MTTVRKARNDDIACILEVAEEAITPAWTYRSVHDALCRRDTLLLVAEKNDTVGKRTVIGFASFRQVGDDGELLQIAVEKDSRRTGTGSLLLETLLSHATERALESVFLEVRAGNRAAIDFYKKHGFTQIRIRKDYYDNPVEDAVVMARKGCPE